MIDILILFIVGLFTIKITIDLFVYFKTYIMSKDGITNSCDKDFGISVDSETGEAELTERPVIRY